MIYYTSNIDSISIDKLLGFFASWPNPPSPETHLKLLHQSDEVLLVVDDQASQAVNSTPL